MNMKRRDFFKVVTGFVAGIFAGSVEGKKRSGTRYCGEVSTSIDPNSEWAKQKPLTLDDFVELEDVKRLTQIICDARCSCIEQKMIVSDKRLVIICPHKPPYYVNPNGSKESVFYYPRAVDIREHWA